MGYEKLGLKPLAYFLVWLQYNPVYLIAIPIILWATITYFIMRKAILKNSTQEWDAVKIPFLIALIPIVFSVDYWFGIFITLLDYLKGKESLFLNSLQFKMSFFRLDYISLVFFGIMFFIGWLLYKRKFSFRLLRLFLSALIIGLACCIGLAYIYIESMEHLIINQLRRDPAYVKRIERMKATNKAKHETSQVMD